MFAATTMLMPNVYTTTLSTYVCVSNESASTADSSTDLSASQMISNDVAMLLRSDRVFDETAEMLGLDDIDDYRVEVESDASSRVIILSVSGPSPSMTAKIADAMVETVSRGAREVMGVDGVIPFEGARVPHEPSGPNRPLYTFVAVVGGLFLAIAVALASEELNTRVRDENEVADLLGVPVLSRIIDMDGSAASSGDASTRALMHNSFKSLVANLRFVSIDTPLKTIAITSSVPNEGKSTIAVGLAQAFAEGGARVLLVECDMRRRSLSAMIKVHASHGICSVLSGAVDLDRAVVPTGQKGLFFLDCEPSVPSPLDVISSQKFSKFIRDLGTAFDMIILDTPPLSAFVDAASIGAISDGTLIVVRKAFVRRDDLLQSCQQLETAKARVVGSVVNFCEQRKDDYYAYYKKSNTPVAGGRRA